MTSRLRRTLAAAGIALVVVGCSAQPHPNRSSPTMQKDTPGPSPTASTAAPLRNRMRVELHASVADVWALIGNLERYPEYSAGLERVDVTRDAKGKCTEYVCHFRPVQEGQGSMSHREIVRWFEPNRGYASMADDPNTIGLQDFGSSDAPAQKAIFEQALADISERLAARFGGRRVENYVESAQVGS